MGRNTKQNQKDARSMRPLNPLAVTVEGLVQLLSKAQSVGMFFIAVTVAGAVFGIVGPSPSFTKDPTGHATETFVRHVLDAPLDIKLTWVAFIVIIALFILVVTTMIHGIASYTALQLSKGRDAKLGEAFNAVLEHFGNYFILVFLINIKVVLWGLLFFVPGIIAYYRYSFAGLLFFDEQKNLRGDAALQASSKLAKGGIVTIFASQFPFSAISFFYAQNLIALCSQAMIYREYSALAKSGAHKPPTHVFSWIVLLGCIAALVGLIVMSVLFGAAA